MTKYLRLSFVFCLLAFCCDKLWANDKEVRLASLEWPPYTGKSLPGQGASAAIAREAFKAMGYTLIIDFYPWTRAVNLVKHNSRFVGYFPEYYSSEIEKQYFYSDVIGSGVLGFAERENKPVVWNSLDDLAWLKIGVVQDYVNTEELDQKIAQKKLQSDVATNDLKNLLKLNGKRIDLAVVDQNVFNFLINTSPELASAKKQLRFNERILENKSLFVCFRKDPEGERLQKIFNEGLKKININAIMAAHLK
jgi:polar amino acid transport system substrate-binding protein